jgi:N-acetylglutamate synthase-like GNAT family acetyltransferase
MMTLAISEIEKLSEQHIVAKFKCGKNWLDHFLRKHALPNQRVDSSQTWVVHRDNVVIGYYTLVYGGASLDEMPAALGEDMPSRPIGIMLLACWAVEKNEQGQGIGKALLKDAFFRIVSAAEIGGLKAIVVDAIDDKMAAWYRERGFTDCPIGSPSGKQRLMISIQDVRASLGM